MLNNKKSMILAIILLVLATLALTSLSLYTFYQRERNIGEKIYVGKLLEQLYVKEEKINLYISMAMDDASKEGDFVENLKFELEKYKVVAPELSQLDEQMDNVKIGEKIEAEFEIKLGMSEDVFSASHIYVKKFEKTWESFINVASFFKKERTQEERK